MRSFLLAFPLMLAPLAPAHAQDSGSPRQEATVLQGGIARWSGADASECGIQGRRYAAVAGDCYYPIDMKATTGVHEVALWNAAGERSLGSLTVEARECTETEITLDRLEYIDVSSENRARAAKERAEVLTAVEGVADVHPRFSLPLAPPAAGADAVDRSDFCERRLYNDKIRSEHTGLDYLIGLGTAVTAPADGTVTLAADHFYTGRAVMVDHGGGLLTMMFHLGELAVEKGDQVKLGDRLGEVGESGRATGPHLHFGARWHDQRIDAGALLRDPAGLPGIGEASTQQPAADITAVEDAVEQTIAEEEAGDDEAIEEEETGDE